MGTKTNIRWAHSTWNTATGCTEVSPGCANCYARTLAERWGPTSVAYPTGFRPLWRAHKLDLPRKWTDPRVIFVNSMTDLMHRDFTTEQVDSCFNVMLDVERHDYLLLTKRPKRLAQYLLGHRSTGPGWLERRGLDRVPDHIWLGTSIELDAYTWRADWLRRIPVSVRFLSCEPLLGPLPSLDLTGLSWVIVGGESGRNFRPMDLDWARDLRDRCLTAQDASGIDLDREVPTGLGTPIIEITPDIIPPVPAFYFKQSAAYHTERGVELDGRRWQQYPAQRVHRPHVAELVGRADGLVGLGAKEAVS